jgi:hypothetical protein
MTANRLEVVPPKLPVADTAVPLRVRAQQYGSDTIAGWVH